MLSKIFPKLKSKTSGGDISLEATVPDFVPYACHYSPETILTKNGELIQVIKIVGFYNERIGEESADLREILQKSVLDNVKNNDFALWFHTIRKKHNLDPGGDFAPNFAMNLNKVWKQRNDWENQYVNEVYVSVIRDGVSIGKGSPKEVVRSAIYSALKKRHDVFLAKAHEELTGVVNGMLETLKNFGAKRLSIVERKDGFYSEQLQFFAKILNLSETLVPVPLRDLSEYLASNYIAFGFNTMEVRSHAGKKFGAIFTIKEARKVPAASLDNFLQLPQEFIICQTLDFINSKEALKEFQKPYEVLHASGADDFAEAIGLNAIIEGNTGSITDFGNSQTTIFLIDSKLQQLEQNIYNATEALKTLGIVATRRDLRLEECFWAQLPGNFLHLSRRKPIPTSRAGVLASLYNFPAGNRSGNFWGPAVTAFHTAGGTPYFFNFHKGDNGHTTILGPTGSGKTVLLNFLVAESRKFNCRLFFFDQLRAAKVFINAMGGNYSVIKPLEPNKKYGFNPFHLENTEKNRAFLKKWIILVAEASGVDTSPQEREHLAKLVDYVCSLPLETRRISAMAGHFGNAGAVGLETKMAPWHGTGQYAHLFDNVGGDITSFQDMMYGFGMSYVLQDQASLGPVLSYLLYQIETSLDGRPTMIVVDEAWKLINTPLFAYDTATWLDRMREKNAIVIFASENLKNTGSSELTRQISSKIATNIFLPNQKAAEYSTAYREVWGLKDEEFQTLAAMNVDKRQFMLRQGDVSVVATLDLSGMRELDVLSGSDKTVKMMEEAVASVGENPNDWIPVFYERMRESRGELLNEDTKLFIA